MSGPASVRVALIDSGINPAHPHLRDGASAFSGCLEDTLGHGTAVAAAICHLAPGVELHSIGALDNEDGCSAERISDAISESIAAGATIINLSAGVSAFDAPNALIQAVELLLESGVTLVAPASCDGAYSFPGCMEGVEGVVADPGLKRGEPEQRIHEGRSFWFASPLPRDLPGLAQSRNLSGVSMAIANVTGYLAAKEQARRQ